MGAVGKHSGGERIGVFVGLQVVGGGHGNEWEWKGSIEVERGIKCNVRGLKVSGGDRGVELERKDMRKVDRRNEP